MIINQSNNISVRKHVENTHTGKIKKINVLLYTYIFLKISRKYTQISLQYMNEIYILSHSNRKQKKEKNKSNQ